MQDVKKQQINSAIDIMKLVMAVLVVGIHTEPFHANIWLDRGFGMITRLCLPFFFAASAYFFFKSGKPLKAYLGRIILLYAVWSFIYLPFVLDCWQLGAYVLLIPLLLKILRGGGTVVSLINAVGTRNGLFYAPAYLSMGLWFAERGFASGRKRYWLMLLVSLLFLAVESVVFVIYYKTSSTILWLSVYPASYALFQLVAAVKCQFKKSVSVWMRKISILLYVMHGLFLMAFSSFGYGFVYFTAVLCCSGAASAGIILLSGRVKILKYFY